MLNKDLLELPGKRVVMLGNEAIARGAMEAGVAVVACYPGTPSAEVSSSLADASKEHGFYFEWSTNEKVAAEVAAGAAFCGVRSMTAMKHFGFNVAADSILPLAYTGVVGGMVIMVADDPLGHSSAQSEQDSRFFARMGNFPVLEPSTIQECKDFTKRAFEISERYQIPVILRTTTMVSHSTGNVTLGELKKPRTEGNFIKNPDRYFNLSPNLQKLHKNVLDKLDAIEKACSPMNKLSGKGRIGIITSGASYNYVKEVNPKARIAKLNLTYPVSKKFVSRFLKGLKTVVVVEELEPFLEGFVKEIALEVNPKVKIYGKNIFSRIGEYNPEIVAEGLKKAGVKTELTFKPAKQPKITIPSRFPDFCAGCPHKFTFNVIKDVLGENVVWAGDIGCYSMGIFKPYNMIDFVISMGASLGIAHGMKKATKQKIVAFMGDSTFFHAGMPGLANIIFNNSDPLIIIMDNSITAMTGHQPNPGTGANTWGEPAAVIKIEDVVKAMGIKKIAIIDPAEKEKSEAVIKEFALLKEPAVIISRRMCVLYRKKAVASGTMKLGE